jgi:alkanesulfonate monooxygenase SsuD/methylene tetrahydromethanopterin reductase-like flavin-dependent oxidoreductase (luciferase family)
VGERYTLRAVARHADEWNMPGVQVAAYRQKVAALETHCEREGRDPASIARSIVYTHAIAESEAAARRAAEALVAQTDPAYRPGVRPDGPAWLVGTPSQVVEELQALAAEGVSRVMLQFRQPPSRDQLELIAAEIVPHV